MIMIMGKLDKYFIPFQVVFGINYKQMVSKSGITVLSGILFSVLWTSWKSWSKVPDVWKREYNISTNI